MISFKGNQFPKHIILHAVHFSLRYSISLRELEELLAERGVIMDPATFKMWVVNFSPLASIEAHKRKRASAVSWRMPCQVRDETYSSGNAVFLRRH